MHSFGKVKKIISQNAKSRSVSLQIWKFLQWRESDCHSHKYRFTSHMKIHFKINFDHEKIISKKLFMFIELRKKTNKGWLNMQKIL